MSHPHLTATPLSRFQLIFNNALKAYQERTRKDLLTHPLAAQLLGCDSPDAIIAVLQGLNQSSRSSDEQLWLVTTVNVIFTATQVLGDNLGLAFSPASAIFAGIGLLLSAVKDVRGQDSTLIDILERIGNFFRRLTVYTKVPPATEMVDIVVRVMAEVISILGIVTKEIKQGRMKKFGKKLIGRTDLEDALKRLDNLTDEEAQIASAEVRRARHAFDERESGVGEQTLAKSDRVDNKVVEVINDGIDAKRDRLQQDIKRWLSPPDPSTNHNFIREARHHGTAAWFFENGVFTEWKMRGSLLWIHGKPGAGKSTLLSAIIQDFDEVLHASGLAKIVYYYFDFRDVKKQDCYGLLSSLILQLSAESDPCYKILSKLYLDHAGGIRNPDYDALKRCMIDMLNLPGQAPIYVIIDALDDCPNFPGKPSAREEVLDLLEELVDLKFPNLHLCVASRPEIDIRIVLEPLTSLKISLHEERGQKEDITEYVKSVVHSDGNMRRWNEEDMQLVIDTLSDKADGMFGWIVCQVDRLSRTSPRNIWSVLNDLPETLDETFVRTLLGIDEEIREHTQQLFRCLAVAIRPLYVEELAEIFAIRLNKTGLPTFNPAWRPENPEEALISACSSLIAIVDRDGSRIVEFSHFTVKQFLTSDRLAASEERLSYYHILPEPAHTLLAHACLSILLQLDDKIDRNSIAQFPLAPYAARQWVDHAQFGNASVHLREVMERLFDAAKPHFAAWVWLYDIDRHSIEPSSNTHPTQPGAVPLYYAALCGFRGLVEHLIAADPQHVNSRGGSHSTPLHAASVNGHLDVTSLLLENGADPNSRDDRGRAPLHRVSQGRRVVMEQSSLDIAWLLVRSGADVNVADDEGWTPLHAAARSGYRDIAEVLLGSGATLDVRNTNQRTPLHLSCGHGMLGVSRYLIDCGSNIISWDNEGFIPLHLASRYGHVEIARLLLDHGADANIQRDGIWSPLHLASANGHFVIVELLVERGARVDVRSMGFVGTL